MSKSERRYRQRLVRPMLAFAALAALAVVLAPTGSAKPPTASIKLYQMCLTAGNGLSPCTTWDTSGGAVSTVAGSHAEMQVTMHNDATSNVTLGSANLTVPAGLGLTIDTAGSTGETNYSTYASTSTSTTLQLRNLNLAANGQVTVAFFVNSSSATCGEGTWGMQVKQSNDFNGTGNDFSPPTKSSGLTSLITSGCHLAWKYQPASADQSTPITDTAFTQSGINVHSVAVQILDGSNQPLNLNSGTVTLAVTGSFDDCGTDCTPQFTGTSATFQSGTATFPKFMSAYTGIGFTATASALGLNTPASSPPFVIQTNGVDCVGQNPCTVSGSVGNGQVTINANGGKFLYLAVSSTQLPSSVTQGGGCDSFIGTGTSFTESDARNGDGTLDITISIKNKDLKRVYGPNYGQPNVPICAGVKRLDADNNPVECSNDPLGGFADRHLTNGIFDGTYGTAVCGAGGYWWGVLGTFQDPLSLGFDSTLQPLITAWGSSPDGVYRTFTVHEPGASTFAPSGWDGKMGA